jgi:hypothetical protein
MSWPSILGYLIAFIAGVVCACAWWAWRYPKL